MIVAAYATAAVVAPLVRLHAAATATARGGPGGRRSRGGRARIACVVDAHARGFVLTHAARRAVRSTSSTRGPYRFVRHPGYAGSLLIWTGFALTSRSLPVVEVVVRTARASRITGGSRPRKRCCVAIFAGMRRTAGGRSGSSRSCGDRSPRRRPTQESRKRPEYVYLLCTTVGVGGSGHIQSAYRSPPAPDSTPRSSLDEHTITRYQPAGSPFAPEPSGAVLPTTSNEPDARLSDASTTRSKSPTAKEGRASRDLHDNRDSAVRRGANPERSREDGEASAESLV